MIFRVYRDLYPRSRSCSSSSLDGLLLEVHRYLYIKVKEKLSSPPSLPVDEMWHAFILTTKVYIPYCERVNNGEYIHHDPTKFQSGTKDSMEAYRLAYKRYEQVFKVVPPALYWVPLEFDYKEDEEEGHLHTLL